MSTIVNCLICGAKVELTKTNKFRPFCSERCHQIDLGAWAEEKYVIPVTNPLDNFDDEAPPTPDQS